MKGVRGKKKTFGGKKAFHEKVSVANYDAITKLIVTFTVYAGAK